MILYGNKDTEPCAHKMVMQIHIVFTPKYRRKVIYNQNRNSLFEYKGVKIIEGGAHGRSCAYVNINPT